MAKKSTLGFGFIPAEAQHHFLVVLGSPLSKKDVLVYERFVWDKDVEEQFSELPFGYNVLNSAASNNNYSYYYDSLRICLKYDKWEKVRPALEAELNRILKSDNKKVYRFKTGQNPVERLLGKEMLILLWAIEDCDPIVIPNAIKNWLGLSREERWWLFTMTNATTGGADMKKGWRIALRYALTDNPVLDNKSEINMFESLKQNRSV